MSSSDITAIISASLAIVSIFYTALKDWKTSKQVNHLLGIVDEIKNQSSIEKNHLI